MSATPTPPTVSAAPAVPAAPAAKRDLYAVQPAPPPRPSHSRRPLVILLLLLVAAGVWWGYVYWYAPMQAQMPAVITGSGTLEADEVLISFETAGRLVALVDEGQQVAADEIVAQLDDELMQLQMRQANTAQMQQLQILDAKYTLHAPLAGTVTRVPVHKGEVVTPGQVVLALADLNQLDLTAYILERDLGGVKVGQTVQVTADPFPGRVFNGVVISTNQEAEFTPRNVQTKADRLNMVFGVNIRVENPDGALKPGMPADVTFGPLP